MTGFEELFERLTAVIGANPLPAGMKPVPGPVNGPGFFPGASGNWPKVPAQDSVRRRFLMLAHDFGTEADYQATKDNGGELQSVPTWLRTLQVLGEAGIDPKDCYFTNAVIALRDAETNTGGAPGLKGKAARKLWADCLAAQIAVVQPQVLVVLGAPAWRIACAADGRKCLPKSFAEFDRGRQPVEAQIGAWKLPTVLLLHPSLREANLWRRGGGRAEAHRYEMTLLTKIK